MTPTDSLSFTLTSLLLALIGWGGLTNLVLTVDPRKSLFPLWLFFVFWLVALTGTALPFVRYLNRRFAHALPPINVMLRQAIWVGLFGATIAWLQKGGILNLAIAALLVAGLGGVEWFLRWRETSRWTPETETADESA